MDFELNKRGLGSSGGMTTQLSGIGRSRLRRTVSGEAKADGVIVCDSDSDRFY